MKKGIFSIFLVFITSLCLGQKLDKITGDKEVISINHSITESFNRVEVNNNLKVIIKQTKRNSYLLTADKNLTDEVKFDIVNGVLRIHTSSKITSSKKLEILLSLSRIIELVVNDEAEVVTEGKIKTDSFNLLGNDGSKFQLTIEAEKISIVLTTKSYGKLDLKAKELSVNMRDRTELKGKLDFKELNVFLSKNAQFNVDGKGNNAYYNLEGSSELKGKGLKTSTASLASDNSTDIYVHATKDLSINAKGRSKIYVYGSPNITVEGLTNRSSIIKK